MYVCLYVCMYLGGSEERGEGVRAYQYTLSEERGVSPGAAVVHQRVSRQELRPLGDVVEVKSRPWGG